jgi:hypothetical protein
MEGLTPLDLTFYEGFVSVKVLGFWICLGSHSSIRACGVEAAAQVGGFEDVWLPHLQSSVEPRSGTSVPHSKGSVANPFVDTSMIRKAIRRRLPTPKAFLHDIK